MKKCLFLTLSLLVSGLAFAQDNSEEPKATFLIQFNEQEYFIQEGELLDIDGAEVSVALANYKTLEMGPVSFDYPNSFSYDFEGVPGYKNWTLDGNDFVIMCFEFDGETGLDDFVDEMVSQFGKRNSDVEKTEITLGGKTLEGKKISVSLAGQSLTIDFLEIALNDGKTRFIAFQDLLTSFGENSLESASTLEMINETIAFE